MEKNKMKELIVKKDFKQCAILNECRWKKYFTSLAEQALSYVKEMETEKTEVESFLVQTKEETKDGKEIKCLYFSVKGIEDILFSFVIFPKDNFFVMREEVIGSETKMMDMVEILDKDEFMRKI